MASHVSDRLWSDEFGKEILKSTEKRSMMHPSVDEFKCIGCGACFKVCPVKPKVMEMIEVEGKGRKSVIVHPEVCDFGAACVRVCPTGAFQLSK